MASESVTSSEVDQLKKKVSAQQNALRTLLAENTDKKSEVQNYLLLIQGLQTGYSTQIEENKVLHETNRGLVETNKALEETIEEKDAELERLRAHGGSQDEIWEERIQSLNDVITKGKEDLQKLKEGESDKLKRLEDQICELPLKSAKGRSLNQVLMNKQKLTVASLKDAHSRNSVLKMSIQNIARTNQESCLEETTTTRGGQQLSIDYCTSESIVDPVIPGLELDQGIPELGQAIPGPEPELDQNIPELQPELGQDIPGSEPELDQDMPELEPELDQAIPDSEHDPANPGADSAGPASSGEGIVETDSNSTAVGPTSSSSLMPLSSEGNARQVTIKVIENPETETPFVQHSSTHRKPLQITAHDKTISNVLALCVSSLVRTGKRTGRTGHINPKRRVVGCSKTRLETEVQLLREPTTTMDNGKPKARKRRQFPCFICRVFTAKKGWILEQHIRDEHQMNLTNPRQKFGWCSGCGEQFPTLKHVADHWESTDHYC